MANSDSREIPAGDGRGCGASGRGSAGVKKCEREEMKVELHLFLMDWYRQGGNLTRCLFDRAFRMRISY